MLHRNLFENEKREYESMVDSAFQALLDFPDETSLVLKVDNLAEASKNTYHIFPSEIALQVSQILSEAQSKNVFLVNEDGDSNLKNGNTYWQDNFYKLYASMSKVFKRRNTRGSNMNILNMQSPLLQQETSVETLYLESREIANDVAILRNLGQIDIFVPADSNEASYLLKTVEKNFFQLGQDNFSYFKLSSAKSPIIYDSEYFEKEGYLKEWTGLPEIVYFSKNLDAQLDVAIIACGPILYNALVAAKDLERENYRVTVLNMSLISSSKESLNEKIRDFINNFVSNHKNILTLEEHSRVGGLGSLISEIVSSAKSHRNVEVERLGLEDDLTPRNISEKCKEIARL